jgi:hypothetical protein
MMSLFALSYGQSMTHILASAWRATRDDASLGENSPPRRWGRVGAGVSGDANLARVREVPAGAQPDSPCHRHGDRGRCRVVPYSAHSGAS